MPEIKYEIRKEFGIVSDNTTGWIKELNLISWNDREPVYDIRTWKEDHERMGKGVTLTTSELKNLRDLLNSMELGEGE